jgi:hypothetical protein
MASGYMLQIKNTCTAVIECALWMILFKFELIFTSSLSGFSCSMSSDTSSFNSECQDDEEIALAMQAAEIANRNEARAKFRFVFVCMHVRNDEQSSRKRGFF